jgi:DNA-directed RNA polymerase subunit M/transcription elongation factor TFIIS
MPMSMKLPEPCAKCGSEEIFWWSEDETESVDEVYVTCDGCGHEFPKRYVDKSEDTDRVDVALEINS